MRDVQAGIDGLACRYEGEFPAEHWRRIRHTNLIERTFGEIR